MPLRVGRAERSASPSVRRAGTMAVPKQSADWARLQHGRIAHRDSAVPPGPRTQATWTAAREELREGGGQCLQPLWGTQPRSADASGSTAEPGAGHDAAQLRELQEVCRQHAREVLSTAPTSLDPMQFTRMVCGRPVQVTQRFSCSSVSVCLPQWVVVARVCVRSSHVHLFLFFCKTCVDSMAEVCPRLSGRPPHTHLREFQVARIPRSGHLPPISRTRADRTPLGEPGAAASPRPSKCGEASTASQAPPICDLPPLWLRSEVMVFQHEAAGGVSTYPYLSTRFRGVPVREMLGRSATRVPPGKKEEAVYYG